MSDQQATTEQPAANSEQTAPAIPEGHVLITQEEHQRFKTNSERVAGMQKYWEAGSKHGIKAPEDFARLTTPPDADDEPNGKSQPLTPERIAAIAEGSASKIFAIQKHQQDESAQEAMIDEAVSQLVEKNASEWDRAVVRDAVQARFDRLARADDNLYPEGHPLRPTHFKPLGKEALSKVVKDMRAVRDTSVAKAKEQKAQAAIGATLPAGKPGGQGQAQQQQATRTTRESLKEQAAARYAQLQNERPGSPM